MIYQPGKVTSCDYGSRHPPKKSFNQEEIDEWGIEYGLTLLVNQLLVENIPKTVTTKILQQETSSDKELRELMKFFNNHHKDGWKKNLKEYNCFRQVVHC